MALNVLYATNEKIYPAYLSKQNLKRKKLVILLTISNGEGWHYLAVKKLSALLREISSKDDGGFHCLNCLHLFSTKNKIESHKKVCENKDFCSVVKPSEDAKILQCNQYQKSDKAPFIIYADLESAIENFDWCKNSPEKPSV